MIKYLKRSIRDSQINEQDEFIKGNWVAVYEPKREELELISKKLKLEEGHLKDAIDPHEVPRLEIEGEDIYIFTRIPNSEEGGLFTVPLLIVISEEFLLTLSKKELAIFDRFLNNQIDFSTTQKTKFFIQLFFEINDYYNRSINNLSKNIYDVSIKLDKVKNEDIVRLISYEQALNDYLNALLRTGSILKTILSGKFLKLFEEDRDLVEDLLLSNEQQIILTQNSLQTVKNVRDAYSTILTNNLNSVIKFFTSLTIILTIPTMIASFFGMNVNIPFSSHPAGFFIILLATSTIVGGLVYLFNKKNWL